jgi:hypothetical protein
MARSPKPTLDDIDAWRKELKPYWEPRQGKVKVNREVYHNEHEVEAPLPASDDLIAAPYEMRSGRAGELCDHAIGLLDVEPQYSTDSPGKRAENAEAWFNLIRRTAEQEQGEDTNSRATGETIIIGYSAIKVLPDPKLWRGQYPKQGIDRDGKAIKSEDDASYNKRVKEFGHTAPVPIVFWHVPGETWFPLLNGRNVIKSLECKEVTRSYLQARYGEKLSGDSKELLKSLNKGIELVEYIDDRWCGWYVFGPGRSELRQELRVWEHRMPVPEGQAPVVLVEGLTTSDNRPGYRWKALIQDVRESIVAQDVVLSRSMTVVQLFFWLTIIHRIKKGQGLAELESLKKTRKFTIGGTNFVMENEELEVLGPPGQLPDAESLYAKLEERIQRAWPPILSGVVEGVSSGYEFNIARDTALTRVKPIAQRLAQADADLMRMACYALGGLSKILRKENLMVYVRQTTEDGVKPIGMSWEQVRDLIPLIRAKREEDLPTDVHSKIDAAIKAHAPSPTGLGLPWAHVIEEIYGAENPEALKELRDIENIVDSPRVLQRTEDDVFREMEILLNEQEGMGLDEALGAGGAPLPDAFAQALGPGGPGVVGPNDPMLVAAAGMGGGAPGPLPGTPPMGGMPAAPPPSAPPVPAGSPVNVQRTNPRAGTSTQNRGRRRKAGPTNTQGRSR